jgi:hypothetical protein
MGAALTALALVGMAVLFLEGPMAGGSRLLGPHGARQGRGGKDSSSLLETLSGQSRLIQELSDQLRQQEIDGKRATLEREKHAEAAAARIAELEAQLEAARPKAG